MLELFFSACGAGACVVLMILILKDFLYSMAARAFFVLIFGGFVHLCRGWLPEHLSVYAYMIESATPAFFWISCRLIFQEGRPLPKVGLILALYSFITPAAALLLGLDVQYGPHWLIFITRTIPQWLEYALIIMGVVALLRGREDDLVESRRRLRWAIMGAAGLSLGWSIFSFNFNFASAASRILAIDVSILMIIVFLFRGRTEIWSEAKALSDSEGELLSEGEILTPPMSLAILSSEKIVGDSDALLSLKDLMTKGFYRRENLTLKDLANEMALPEYRIRAVINKEMKYRNFNEFINEYRINEAAQRLIKEPDTPISNIALDVGYRTLSSFNRAFRKEKNTTPTAYRDNV